MLIHKSHEHLPDDQIRLVAASETKTSNNFKIVTVIEEHESDDDEGPLSVATETQLQILQTPVSTQV